MRTRSKKMAKLYRDKRVPLIKEMIENNTPCAVGAILEAETHYAGCTKRATTLHEKRKRSANGSIINPKNTIPSCSNCNYYVEKYPEISHSLGLVLREGDEGWEEMSKRND